MRSYSVYMAGPGRSGIPFLEQPFLLGEAIATTEGAGVETLDNMLFIDVKSGLREFVITFTTLELSHPLDALIDTSCRLALIAKADPDTEECIPLRLVALDTWYLDDPDPEAMGEYLPTVSIRELDSLKEIKLSKEEQEGVKLSLEHLAPQYTKQMLAYIIGVINRPSSITTYYDFLKVVYTLIAFKNDYEMLWILDKYLFNEDGSVTNDLSNILDQVYEYLEVQGIMMESYAEAMRQDKPKKELHKSLVEKIKSYNIPEQFKKNLISEAEVLEAAGPSAKDSETLKLREYFRWINSIPWNWEPQEFPPLEAIKQTLSETHYGLEDIKDIVNDILCVDIINEEINGLTLCFLGPPGTGKTSVAKSIAKALKRDVVHIALGGVEDPTELRGHRRTYVGARPGRIVQGLARSKTLAPVIILDEIDKLASNMRGGDPSAVLLEILDPEQNKAFIDHYLEVPIDLSRAIFITTANYESGIPAPLLDRMEVVRFRKYSDHELFEIIKQYIIPAAQQTLNKKGFDITIEDNAIRALISQDKSLRRAKQIVNRLLRHAITSISTSDRDKFVITQTTVNNILGKKNNNRIKPIGF